MTGKFGKEKRDQHRKDVALFWDNLRTIINAVLANLDGTAIRIYQDGIPIGGEIGAKLVAMGAKDGVPNHQIVLSIIEHGGVLEKTESPALLKEEYRDYQGDRQRKDRSGTGSLKREAQAPAL